MSPYNEALAAIEAGASNSYDLVLMGLMMPEMDGATATRILHEKEVRTDDSARNVMGCHLTE
jgi:CheY-like chemotaxis protein